jgi:anti-sigma regulatory factor (Ser/Thr protein kinase)
MAIEEALYLSLDAEPENVAVARAAVAELGADLGMIEPTLGDLKTVVSEACSNVVRHAYSETEGTFEVEAFAEEGRLAVVVRDFGTGMRARVQTDESSLRLGLGLISMLTIGFDIRGGVDGGTEVRMQLPFHP